MSINFTRWLLVTFLLVSGASCAQSRSIADDIEVSRSYGEYSLYDTRGNVLIADQVEGWILKGNFIAGSFSPRAYFAYDRACQSRRIFHDISDFVKFTRTLGIDYKYADEEGPGDVFFGKESRFRGEHASLVCDKHLFEDGGIVQ